MSAASTACHLQECIQAICRYGGSDALFPSVQQWATTSGIVDEVELASVTYMADSMRRAHHALEFRVALNLAFFLRHVIRSKQSFHVLASAWLQNTGVDPCLHTAACKNAFRDLGTNPDGVLCLWKKNLEPLIAGARQAAKGKRKRGRHKATIVSPPASVSIVPVFADDAATPPPPPPHHADDPMMIPMGGVDDFPHPDPLLPYTE